MARTFSGSDNITALNMTAINTGSWTMGAWIYQTAAQQGQIIVTTDQPITNAIQWFRIENGNPNLNAIQNSSGTFGNTTTSTSFAISKWWAVFATFNSADSLLRIYYGDVTTSVAEAAYSTQTAMTATRLTGGTRVKAGNNSSDILPFAGYIDRPFFDGRLWTTGEMDAYRLCTAPSQTGNLRVYWPLSSSSEPTATDASGSGVTGTFTGTTWIQGQCVDAGVQNLAPVIYGRGAC